MTWIAANWTVQFDCLPETAGDLDLPLRVVEVTWNEYYYPKEIGIVLGVDSFQPIDCVCHHCWPKEEWKDDDDDWD